MVWFIAIGILLILSLLLLLFNVKIRLKYCFQKNNHHVTVQVYYMKVRVIHRKININEYTIDETQLIDYLHDYSNSKVDKDFNLKKIFNKLTKQLRDIVHMLMLFIKSISIHELKWITQFGTGDASSTGTLTGGVWTLKGAMIGFLFQQTEMKVQPKVSVIPHFQQKGIYSEVDCIVTIRLGKAIHIAMQLLRSFAVKEEAYI
ncbi:DUF2953 domain-containing protein [Paucisalibacillus globulus]|uniref:DUF2953 domain-containing protein n=1 Tax=Paucisalibacillus globulus TaxID=351095 RepID=UPI0004148E5A|nr:DUF2953 domain-containing protein [Paucisalibacillus globulus]